MVKLNRTMHACYKKQLHLRPVRHQSALQPYERLKALIKRIEIRQGR
jgi:hypothetical protein